MIVLPKMLSATSNDCVVASVQMICMYWRQEKPNLDWKNATLDFGDAYWSHFYSKGLRYVRDTGMPTNNIKRFLKTLGLPLNAELQFLEDGNSLRRLIDINIPPVVLYDRHYYFKQVQGLGHAVVLVDYTKENFVSIDPAFAPKFTFRLAETDFLEAWKQKKNSVIIINPKTYRFVKTQVPSTTLLPYLTVRERGQ
jgi:ABC-type bacteriocin/lantibiotic exporter with double-glycine peptidase domain